MNLGLNPNIPAADYHAFDAVSNSRLGKLADSPAHFRYHCDNPEEKTEPMILGSAMHSYLLEPELFDKEYVFRPAGLDMRRTADKEHIERMKREHPGKEILKPEYRETLEAMAASIAANKCASALLNRDGDVEMSLLWKDPEHGVLIKSRLDFYAQVEDRPTIIDLKTTQDASAKGFATSLYRYGYYRQAPLYLDGMSRILGFDHTRFIFIVIEKEPPYAVGVYEIDHQAISAGRQDYKRLLALYNKCKEKKEWPSYAEADEPQLITLPLWAFRELEIEVV
jgi:hypothetical protein